MRKIYIEPEIELMSIRLLTDVLGPSKDQYEEEETVPDNIETFNPDVDDDEI